MYSNIVYGYICFLTMKNVYSIKINKFMLLLIGKVSIMKKNIRKMDLLLLVLTCFYAILGSIMIYSASSILTFLKQDVASNYYFIRQVIILFISFIGSIVILKIPTSKYKYLSPLLFLGISAALGGLYVGGHIANGTKGWYDLGFFNLQPVEFAKPIIIIYLACTYDKLIAKKEKKFIKYLIPLFLCGILAALVLMQPDLGSAIILAGIAFGIFTSLPIKHDVRKNCNKVLIILTILGIFGAVIFKDKIFSSYQIKRLEFQSPCTRYTESTGYQVCNGFIAIKNGGVFGLGFGNSTQKYLYLPEAHTDFIFPIIVEELGLLVGIAIIIGYVIILYRILLIAKKATNLRNSILAYGTFFYLMLHILVNLMGVLALIPLTGVPLPLLSYGGSFTLNAIIMLSLCQKVSIESNNYRLKEKIAEL